LFKPKLIRSVNLNALSSQVAASDGDHYNNAIVSIAAEVRRDAELPTLSR